MASSIKYVKALKRTLYLIGGWPGEVLNESLPPLNKFYRKLLLAQWSISILGQVYYLWNNFKALPFSLTCHMFITTFLSILTLTRIAVVNLKSFGILAKRFLTEFHLYNFKIRGGYYEKVYLKIDNVSNWYTNYLLANLMCTGILFNFAPVYDNVKAGVYTTQEGTTNSTVVFSVYYLYPNFDPMTYFYTVTIFNILATFQCGTCICSLDSLLSLLVFQIIGHILVLIRKLENIPKPKNQSINIFDAAENKEVFLTLKECIEDHRFIVSFTDNVSAVFGPSLAIYYLIHLVCGCLLLLECSGGELNSLIRYGTLTLMLFGQLMQISIVFEVMGHVSEKLIDCVYFVPWECMSTSNRRVVLLFLRRIQTSIRVMAIGVMPVGVTTMASVLKSTLSYFMFLRSIKH